MLQATTTPTWPGECEGEKGAAQQRAQHGLVTRCACHKPVSPAVDYVEKNNEFRTIYGASIDNLTSLDDADIIGFNCGSITLDQAVKFTTRLREKTDKPLFAKPNGGVPAKEKQVYPPEIFAEYGEKIIEAGATLIGGCCRTTPEHVKKLRRVVDKHNTLKSV